MQSHCGARAWPVCVCARSRAYVPKAVWALVLVHVDVDRHGVCVCVSMMRYYVCVWDPCFLLAPPHPGAEGVRPRRPYSFVLGLRFLCWSWSCVLACMIVGVSVCWLTTLCCCACARPYLGHNGVELVRILLDLVLSEHAPLTSAAVRLLLRHFRQHQELCWGFAQVGPPPPPLPCLHAYVCIDHPPIHLYACALTHSLTHSLTHRLPLFH
jgi:hypothetical protein